MKKLDGIIFDIDGTIWDSREVVAAAWKAAIAENTSLSADFDGPTIGKHFGKPMVDIFKALYPELTDAQLAELTPFLYEYEHRYLRALKPQPYDGVREILKHLSKEYPLYIVTNGQKGYTEAMLDATGLHAYFHGWLSYGDTLASKSVTLCQLMEQYGLRNTCYVGDTMVDMNAATSAGIPFVYCSYGLGDVSGAEYEIDTMKALPEVLHMFER